MTHPNCRIQDVISQVLFVHYSGLFISVVIQFYFHAFDKLNIWLVKEEVVVVAGGGGQNIMAIVK